MPSPIGPLRLVADGEGRLSRIEFLVLGQGAASPADLGSRNPTGLAGIRRQIEEYFRGVRTRFEIEIAPDGTDFQQRVWTLVAQIPFGETRSYGRIAETLGGRSLARAVGRANAANPIPIVVPCHRVIGRSGALISYAGGLTVKEYLLRHEGVLAVESQTSLFG